MQNDTIINDIDIIEFEEFILSIIHDYMQSNIEIIKEEKYSGTLFDVVLEIIENCYNDTLISKLELANLIGKNIDFYFKNIGIPRSYPTSIILNDYNAEKMNKHLIYLQNLPQPSLKTDEWYNFRWNHLTASSIWKVLESSQCKQNELILSKCKPIDISKKKKN